MAGIHLSDNAVYPWLRQGDFWVKGNTNNSPASIDLSDVEEFRRVNSCGFTWVYEDEQFIAAATDNIRSFPIFYSAKDDDFILSDSAYTVKDVKNLADWNTEVFPTFRELGYVPGDETLVKNIHVLQCNTLLLFNKNKKSLELVKYDTEIGTQQENLENVLERVFQNLVGSLGGRTAVIPLSGGWDSRLILAGLIKNNYPKILCYTYGKEESYEVKTASRIAEQLKIPWHFIEYTSAIFDNYLTIDGKNYERNASQLSSIAHEQDFFAVQHLKNKDLLPTDSVFLPGFCADVPAGSQVISEDKMASYDSFDNFVLQQVTENTLFLDDARKEGRYLRNTIAVFTRNERQLWQTQYELWLQNNRLSKFISNSIRCFEHFGYRWQLPFWSTEFIDFWKQASYEERYKRSLYKQVIFKNYFEPLKVDFDYGLAEHKIADSQLAQKLKNIAPNAVKNMIKKALTPKSQQDVNNLDDFSQTLKRSQEALIENYKNENQVHAHWYLLHLQNWQESFLNSSRN